MQNVKRAVPIGHDVQTLCVFGLKGKFVLAAVYSNIEGLFVFHIRAKLGQMKLLVKICQKT